MERQAYLGSDSEGEEEDATGGAERLRALLDGDAAAARMGGKAWGAVVIVFSFPSSLD